MPAARCLRTINCVEKCTQKEAEPVARSSEDQSTPIHSPFPTQLPLGASPGIQIPFQNYGVESFFRRDWKRGWPVQYVFTRLEVLCLVASCIHRLFSTCCRVWNIIIIPFFARSNGFCPPFCFQKRFPLATNALVVKGGGRGEKGYHQGSISYGAGQACTRRRPPDQNYKNCFLAEYDLVRGRAFVLNVVRNLKSGD